MKVLVTGGAGYIGSFAVRSLLAAGHTVTVFDSLENGRHREKKARFVNGSLGDTKALGTAMRGQDAVMNFASYINVAESMEKPEKYYRNNCIDSINVLEAMRANKVRTIVFSSTAAVFGNPKKVPIVEDAPKNPINPYGASKLLFEMALAAYERFGISHAILRYFNVAGAAADGSLGEAHEPETHLIPNVLRAAREGRPVTVFGDDYPTKDGTCVRDYVHVQDLIDAHILALNHVHTKKKSVVYNLGSQKGFSVKEVIAACERTVGNPIQIEVKPRRPGDPAVLVASSQKIRRELGWKPKFGIDAITQSAWKWHSGCKK